MSNSNRGASYPSLPLSEAIDKLKLAQEKVGKGPSSKEEYILGLGYSGISGASSRTFAALVHYGLLMKSGVKYQFSELAINILFPQNSDVPHKEDLARAAVSSKLFRQLYERYEGERLPDMLRNTLVVDYQIHDKSAQEAAANFRQTLDFAGLLEGGVVKPLNSIPTERDEDDNVPSVEQEASFVDPTPLSPAVDLRSTDASLNRIEIVLREGVKAGIYAPYNLTESEKMKLKTIIDLL